MNNNSEKICCFLYTKNYMNVFEYPATFSNSKNCFLYLRFFNRFSSSTSTVKNKNKLYYLKKKINY